MADKHVKEARALRTSLVEHRRNWITGMLAAAPGSLDAWEQLSRMQATIELLRKVEVDEEAML